VIEDNGDSLALMSYLLTAFGYEVRTAREGAAGLAEAARERPDLIVCDLHMPGVDGFEVARRLKLSAELRRVPLVAVTALAMVGDRDKVLSAGFDGYVSKPIDPERFVPQLEAFLSERPPPVARAKPQGAPVAAPTPAPAPGGALAAVLLVDNVQANLDYVAALLAPHGVAVRTARTVRKALSGARAERPALIVTDLHLPGHDGFELLRAAKADPALAAIPIIVLTSSFRAETARARCLRLGAERFIERGTEPEAILGPILESLGLAGAAGPPSPGSPAV
jgi:two-component system cell cycle response regulator